VSTVKSQTSRGLGTLRHILADSGKGPVPPGTSNKIEAQYFAKTDPAPAAPDLQPVMSHVPLPVVGQDVPAEGHGYSVAPGTIRTLSRGRLWLRSADPAQAPALDPRYFEEPYDLRAMVTAVRQAREIGKQKALGEWRAREVAPGPGVVTDDEIAAYVKRNLSSYHHQVRDVPDGRRGRRGRGSAATGARGAGAAGRGRVGHAGGAVGQHACADRDDRGALRGVPAGPGPRQLTFTESSVDPFSGRVTERKPLAGSRM
jgi:hypothetical protein